MIEPDYWSAAATVLPVLATALIIEARALDKHRPDRAPKFLKAVQYTILSLLLILIFYVEIICFTALRGSVIEPYWTYLVEASISTCFAVLIGAPAFSFGALALTDYLNSIKIARNQTKIAVLRTRITFLTYSRDKKGRKLNKLLEHGDMTVSKIREAITLNKMNQSDASKAIISMDPETEYGKIAELYAYYYAVGHLNLKLQVMIDSRPEDPRETLPVDSQATGPADDIEPSGESDASLDFRLFDPDFKEKATRN